VRRAAALLAAAALAGLATPAAAAAPATAASEAESAADAAPAPRLSSDRAIAIALRDPRIREARRGRRGSYGYATREGARWKVDVWTRSGRQIGQAYVADATGRVTEAWTGYQVAWTMARGYPGAFGRRVNALYVWLPLLALFLLPFLRGPPRMLHADLAAVASLSVSLALFNHAEIGWSVPLVYPPLVWLLGRMLWLGFRGARTAPARPLRLLVPARWLAIALVFLVGFRVGLNVTNSNVIDVGTATVAGADLMRHGRPLYGHFPKGLERGDTYGPVTYASYVPFVAVFGVDARNGYPAAHAATIVFDLLAMLLLFLVGRRIRGPTLGILLAYGWATFPFTLFVAQSNANDTLVAVLVALALVVAGRPAARGAAVALAGLAKVAPLALAPVLLRTPDRALRVRDVALYVAGFALATLVVLVPFVGDLGAAYDRVVAYQAGRAAPWSVWGQAPSLHWAQVAVQAGGVLLALALAVVPRRRDLVQTAALAAAVLIAIELGVTYWFYTYLVWFLPPLLVAALARQQAADPAWARREAPAGAEAASPPPRAPAPA